jgi:biotin carboxylase
MIELTRGVGMFAATLQGYACGAPAITPDKNGGAAIRYLSLPEGKVASVAGLDQARQSPGVVRCDIDLAVGSDIRSVDSSGARCGYVLAVGASREEALRNVTEAMQHIRIEVE